MKRVFFFLMVAVIASAGMAHADEIPISLQVTVNDQTTVLGDLLVTDREGGFGAEGSTESEDYSLDWEIQGDLDPVLIVAGAITNFTNANLNVAFFFATPVVPVLPPSAAGGSFGGSITDGNGDGVTISDFGGPLYTASFNSGTTFQTLADAPYSFASAVPFGTANIPVESFGIPGLTVPGPGVIVNDMGILITFTLTPHDSAAFTANFVLEPREEVIPEPATLGLMSLGLAGFAGRALRRRKRN